MSAHARRGSNSHARSLGLQLFIYCRGCVRVIYFMHADRRICYACAPACVSRARSDQSGGPRPEGGDAFTVLVRGRGDVCKARVLDGGDGRYRVEYKVHVSGRYARLLICSSS